MSSKHELWELQQMQSLPLDIKIRMTERRIREWVAEFGIDGVYVSFSGGKDSTVLLDICRKLYPEIKAVFCDTGLEYPEIREFVRGYSNVDWLKPDLTFKQVIEKYGYPFISKEVADLRTTLCDRTGCVFCGFGCHLEKESRFERLKVTHPKLYDYLMRSKEEGGLDYKTIIDWLNENGNLNIRY